MTGVSRKLSDVYGNSRNLPLTYQTRHLVDDRFVNDITRGKHVVLHGGSKQGKTSVRKYNLDSEEYIAIQCRRDTSCGSLYEMILKNAGIDYEVTESKTIKGTHKVAVKGKAEAKIPFVAKAEGEGSYGYDKENGNTTTTKSFEIDIEDPNDIVRVLTEYQFSKYIVIEDFHYMDESIQQTFAFDLKTFHENSSLIFIIVGVWLESNKLIIFNGDLTNRITNINADDWEDDELLHVIRNGYPFLNISFTDDVEKEIVKVSQQNVGLLQEVCYRICEIHEVWNTKTSNLLIPTSISEVNEIAKRISDDQSTRYRNFIIKFSEGLGVTELEMYKWLIYSVIISEPHELRKGIKSNVIFHKIKGKHPKSTSLQQGNVISALERVSNVQYKHKLQPLILDYSNDELSVVDANFLVFLSTQGSEALFEALNIR